MGIYRLITPAVQVGLGFSTLGRQAIFFSDSAPFLIKDGYIVPPWCTDLAPSGGQTQSWRVATKQPLNAWKKLRSDSTKSYLGHQQPSFIAI